MVLFVHTSDVLQHVNSQAGHTLIDRKSFVHVKINFHHIACEIVSGHVRMFAKCVQHSQNENHVTTVFITSWTHINATHLGVTVA